MELLNVKKLGAWLLAFAGILSCYSALVSGQAPVAGSPTGTAATKPEPRTTPPQVVTVLHRINGFKMLRLLIRSGEKVDAVDSLDQAFKMAGQVHTNIIAGLTLDDGQTVAAWLPEAQVEVESTLSWPANPFGPTSFGAGVPGVPGVPRQIETVNEFDRPDITIILRDGSRHEARYVGLDGVTGLSLLKLVEKGVPSSPNVDEPAIVLGERMHLLSPEPVQENGANRDDAIYVRIGEAEAHVVSLDRGSSGAVNRIRIRSGKLSPSNIGGVAVNDVGETIGIVESIDETGANVLPTFIIQAAAKRVLARQTSVPRPWLGVSGEPIALTSLDQIVRKGWDASRALSLIEKRRGIFLTSVAPGSPAAIAALHAGDVIVSVNETEVKSGDDFSLLLGEAGDDPLRFMVARPDAGAAESIIVKLAESKDPFFAFNFSGTYFGPRPIVSNPWVEQGIETVPLRTGLRTRLGASGGLLVVHVQPGSAAFKSGLLPGDVIEGLDGRPIPPMANTAKVRPGAKGTTAPKVVFPAALEPLRNARYILNVLRNKETLSLTVNARQQ